MHYTFNDLAYDVTLINNSLKARGVDVAYHVYHANDRVCIDWGTVEQIERGLCTDNIAGGTPRECRGNIAWRVAWILFGLLPMKEE